MSLRNPAESHGFLLNVSILLITILIDGSVLIKAMKQIVQEAGIPVKGVQLFLLSYRNIQRAAPPTRLVFYEDTVATFGAFLELISVILTEFTSFQVLDGITTIVIGFLMLFSAFKVCLENMAGLIGVAAPKEVKERVAKIIFSDPYVTDISRLRVIQEGTFYHVESYIELRPGLTLAEADDIKFRIQERLLAEPHIRDVILGITEDNGIRDWVSEKEKVFV
jgi:divalent metal cation (Fe/Co/Zn/Cd) transporter